MKRERGKTAEDDEHVEGKERCLSKSSSSPRAFLFCSTSPRMHRSIYVAESGRYNYSRFEVILPFLDTTQSHTDDRDRLHKTYRNKRGFKDSTSY